MRVILKERPEVAGGDSAKLIEAEIKDHRLGFDIVRWRDMDFVYNGEIVDDKFVYIRATGTTVSWYPNDEGKFTE